MPCHVLNRVVRRSFKFWVISGTCGQKLTVERVEGFCSF